MGTNYGEGTGKSIPLRDGVILNEPEVVEPPKPASKAEDAPKPKHQTVVPQTAGGKATARKATKPTSKTDAGALDFEPDGPASQGGTKDGK